MGREATRHTVGRRWLLRGLARASNVWCVVGWTRDVVTEVTSHATCHIRSWTRRGLRPDRASDGPESRLHCSSSPAAARDAPFASPHTGANCHVKSKYSIRSGIDPSFHLRSAPPPTSRSSAHWPLLNLHARAARAPRSRSDLACGRSAPQKENFPRRGHSRPRPPPSEPCVRRCHHRP